MRTVLYVEDNDDTRIAVAEVLRHAGLAVIEASTAATALTILASMRADVVLLDMMLPDMTGLELRCQIASDPRFAKIPCIAYTAYAGFRQQAEDLNMIFIEKPADLDQLVRTIERVAA